MAKRKVCLIGKAPSSVGLAPYGDESYEIWILNTLGSLNEVPRWTRQYELHDLELTKDAAYGNYYQWLKERSHEDRPVILRDDPSGNPDLGPAASQYPLGAVLETFKHLAGAKYLTNTVSLMLAHAALEHRGGAEIESIGLYGIDMAQHALKSGGAGWFSSEYARQRPSVEYWIGVVEGLGISVKIPDQSDILKSYCVYGYHTDEVWEKQNARRRELQQRIGQAQQREQSAHDEAIFLSGALEGMNYDEQKLFPREGM